MNSFNSLSGKKIFAMASASLFLMSSSAFSASRVSPPPRLNAGNQIVRPGETPELAKQNKRAHSNKLRNKVTIERAVAASAATAMPAAPLSNALSATPASEPQIDVAAARTRQQSD